MAIDSLPDHVRANFVVGSSAECWEWQGCRVQGYGITHIARRQYRAHRVVFEALAVPIPDGMEIDHLCRNRACVNPAHLEPVDHRTNLLRAPRSLPAIAARKTHCPHGHPYEGDNLMLRTRPNGQTSRLCRTCQYAHRRRSDARRRVGSVGA